MKTRISNQFTIISRTPTVASELSLGCSVVPLSGFRKHIGVGVFHNFLLGCFSQPIRLPFTCHFSLRRGAAGSIEYFVWQ